MNTKKQLDSNLPIWAILVAVSWRLLLPQAVSFPRFARKYNWAHLAIAGTAWRSGKAKGWATGRRWLCCRKNDTQIDGLNAVELLVCELAADYFRAGKRVLIAVKMSTRQYA
ncbi:unnamed protein product [Ranitomeya imitator]|uniref:Uncharacterized protein n=1 Tax=Ranitomeya imitator TaxID=111125 RepID=A0ABN9MES5_9NEOB|nr:unnamed protein product [Ranitomeya imitator]